MDGEHSILSASACFTIIFFLCRFCCFISWLLTTPFNPKMSFDFAAVTVAFHNRKHAPIGIDRHWYFVTLGKGLFCFPVVFHCFLFKHCYFSSFTHSNRLCIPNAWLDLVLLLFKYCSWHSHFFFLIIYFF